MYRHRSSPWPPLPSPPPRPPRPPAAPQSPSAVPDLTDIAAFETSSLATVVNRFSSDLGALERKWAGMPYSDARYERMRDFLDGWAEALDSLAVAMADVEGSIDHVLLSAEVRYRRELLAREERTLAKVAPLLPFGPEILELLEIRPAAPDRRGGG